VGAVDNKIQLGADTNGTAEKSLQDGKVKFNIVGDNGIETVGDDANNITVRIDDDTKAKIDKVDDKLDANSLSNIVSDDLEVSNGGNLTAGGDVKLSIKNHSIDRNALDPDLYDTLSDKSHERVTTGAGLRVNNPAVGADDNNFHIELSDQTKEDLKAGKKHTKLIDGKNTEAVKTADDTYKVNVVTSDTAENNDAPVNGRAVNSAINTAITPIKEDVAENKTAIGDLEAKNLKFIANQNETSTQANNTNKIFEIVGEDGVTTEAGGRKITVKLDGDTKGKLADIANKANRDMDNLTDDGKKNITKLGTIVEAEDNSIDVSPAEIDPTTAEAINASFWKTKAKDGVDGGVVKSSSPRKIKAGDEVNFDAGKNMELTQTADGYIYATKDDVEFDKVSVGGVVLDKDKGINAGDKKITGVAEGTD
ncbi:MAG: hypothetical protein CR960_02245, partial [Pasteurellales bacterium]